MRARSCWRAGGWAAVSRLVKICGSRRAGRRRGVEAAPTWSASRRAVKPARRRASSAPRSCARARRTACAPWRSYAGDTAPLRGAFDLGPGRTARLRPSRTSAADVRREVPPEGRRCCSTWRSARARRRATLRAHWRGRRVRAPVMLAGSLDPDNVREARAAAGPGPSTPPAASRRAPGVKDHDLIAAFVAQRQGGRMTPDARRPRPLRRLRRPLRARDGDGRARRAGRRLGGGPRRPVLRPPSSSCSPATTSAAPPRSIWPSGWARRRAPAST
jgi:hypothetical protein